MSLWDQASCFFHLCGSWFTSSPPGPKAWALIRFIAWLPSPSMGSQASQTGRKPDTQQEPNSRPVSQQISELGERTEQAQQLLPGTHLKKKPKCMWALRSGCPLRALAKYTWFQNEIHWLALTQRGKHTKNATKNKIKISTLPPTHVPRPPGNMINHVHNTESKNKTASRLSGSSWVTVGTCLPCGEHIIPNGGQSGLKYPHTLTLHQRWENFNQNHFQSGLTLLEIWPPETAGVLPMTSNKGGTSLFWGIGGGSI